MFTGNDNAVLSHLDSLHGKIEGIGTILIHMSDALADLTAKAIKDSPTENKYIDRVWEKVTELDAFIGKLSKQVIEGADNIDTLAKNVTTLRKLFNEEQIKLENMEKRIASFNNRIQELELTNRRFG